MCEEDALSKPAMKRMEISGRMCLSSRGLPARAHRWSASAARMTCFVAYCHDTIAQAYLVRPDCTVASAHVATMHIAKRMPQKGQQLGPVSIKKQEQDNTISAGLD